MKEEWPSSWQVVPVLISPFLSLFLRRLLSLSLSLVRAPSRSLSLTHTLACTHTRTRPDAWDEDTGTECEAN
jgi:hypothetical protein